MKPIATFDIRGKRLHVVRDPCPENPLNMTDAPYNIDNFNPRACYWNKHEARVERPIAPSYPRDSGYLAVYFDADGDECEYFDASGALYVDRETWQAHAEAPITLAILRAQLAELRAFWQGDVYGFEIVQTFRRAGIVYETPKVLDLCFGFYGAPGVASMADHLESPTFKRAVRRLAKTL
jgi:hypothetical protein